MIKGRKQQITVDWEKRTVGYTEETGKYFFAECFAGTENAPISLFNVNEIQNPDNPKIPDGYEHKDTGLLPLALVFGSIFVVSVLLFCHLF